MSPQYSQLRFLHKVLQSSSKHLNILAKSQFDAYRPGLLRTRNADWYLGNSLGPRKFQTNLAQARLVRPILQHGKRGTGSTNKHEQTNGDDSPKNMSTLPETNIFAPENGWLGY